MSQQETGISAKSPAAELVLAWMECHDHALPPAGAYDALELLRAHYQIVGVDGPRRWRAWQDDCGEKVEVTQDTHEGRVTLSVRTLGVLGRGPSAVLTLSDRRSGVPVLDLFIAYDGVDWSLTRDVCLYPPLAERSSEELFDVYRALCAIPGQLLLPVAQALQQITEYLDRERERILATLGFASRSPRAEPLWTDRSAPWRRVKEELRLRFHAAPINEDIKPL